MYKLRVLLLILSSVFLLNSAAYADETMAPKQPEDVKVETDAEKAKMQADAPKEEMKDHQADTKKN